MPHYKTQLKNEAATDALGRCLARQLVPGLVIYLHGDLGAGKTALTRALLHAAGYEGHVKSPTYTLAEPYEVQLSGQTVTIMHFDLYRMTSPEEFLEAGFRDVFNHSTICVVEWPENGDGVLPAPDLEVFLTVAGTGRHVELRALSEKGSACLNQLNFAPNL
ncbi:tRNA (adenosine(37)-N6)-threonylcarbamoyltransferase complex ATPase subunit type 1 TsaE [Solimicrobium silvestre]|uniref:tRNA threonylcarbamoyladenosine biosynthesis protein TsaE n=1 Tax=Solimicrobium silvestre TaxID=2099400 RepID=A0A2S9H147_9BURK|nr:tRNA (adenosine(37)-N6)-threonylcarbamoyltransferase complex ATPase subunit type 1 TsaE [Solimicrobium silvestre]PRC93586.1 tRNA threonylcarbamoyl adenosine modification protein YjeE [Solimicrobium silvestre]